MNATAALSAPLGGWSGRLSRAPRWFFAAYAGLMAFGTYFAMYAFRKPFAVAQFDGLTALGIDYKVALVIAQVVGYAVAKIVGVKVIAEWPARRRIIGIAAQVALAEVSLVLFAIVPAPWNVACLFLDGLALGMVWGMVFGFVEGRRQSDIIGAMLCASFILASGAVKAAGAFLLFNHYADQWWMPAATGLLFAPLLVACLVGLAALPPPDAGDIAERVERMPMDRAARGRMLRRFGPTLAAMVVTYIMLTALRDFRDSFSAEVWTELGYGGQADVFALTEIPVSVIVLAMLAAVTLVRDNQAALQANLALVGGGLALAGLSSALFAFQWIGPIGWMIALGTGLYLAYTPFNGMLFDRLIAAGGDPGTCGFLIYVADAGGYVGSITLLLVRTFAGLHLHWARFLIQTSIGMAVIGLVLIAFAAVDLRARLRR
jgi:hypothetical protein